MHLFTTYDARPTNHKLRPCTTQTQIFEQAAEQLIRVDRDMLDRQTSFVHGRALTVLVRETSRAFGAPILYWLSADYIFLGAMATPSDIIMANGHGHEALI